MSNEFERLSRIISKLEKENKSLREKIMFFESCGSKQNGLNAELLIAEIINGKLTEKHKEGYDILTQNNEKIEVKYGTLKYVDPEKHGKKYPYWQWVNLLGHNDNKKYDYAILMAEVGSRVSVHGINKGLQGILRSNGN